MAKKKKLQPGQETQEPDFLSLLAAELEADSRIRSDMDAAGMDFMNPAARAFFRLRDKFIGEEGQRREAAVQSLYAPSKRGKAKSKK